MLVKIAKEEEPTTLSAENKKSIKIAGEP